MNDSDEEPSSSALLIPPKAHCRHRRRRPVNGLVRTLHEYLRQSQIHGYGYVVKTDRPYLERIAWACLDVACIAFTAWLVVYAYVNLIVAPTVTSERTNRISVQEIPFPAIAICSNNRISRRALNAYAGFIFNATSNDTNGPQIGSTVEEVAANLLVLGKLFDVRMDENEFYVLDRVHTALVSIYDGVYPIHEILRDLAPKCDEIVKRCTWLGRIANCAELFSFRRTSSGFCCTFNYVRANHSRSAAAAATAGHPLAEKAAVPLRVHQHGPGFGLMLLLDQRPGDYAYALHSNRGVRILVFDPENFPDGASGAVKERTVVAGEEMLLSVVPLANNGLPEMRKYQPKERNCVFRDEVAAAFTRYKYQAYSFSDCLLSCRIQSVLQFCGCLQPQFASFHANESHCLLDDMPCLSRWSDKWYNSESLLSADDDGGGKDDNMILDDHCPNCLPRCTSVSYYLTSSTSNFGQDSFERRQMVPEFTRGLNATNHSIVHINFGQPRVAVFDQTSVQTWYEQLAYFGGLASITLGASVISIVELVYVFTGNFGALWLLAWRERRPMRAI